MALGDALLSTFRTQQIANQQRQANQLAQQRLDVSQQQLGLMEQQEARQAQQFANEEKVRMNDGTFNQMLENGYFDIKTNRFNKEKFMAVKSAYNENGMIIIFLGAFTPLPYKIITITSGMAGTNIVGFVLMSLIGRGIRFFIVAYLTKFFGMSALLFLQRHLLISSSILGMAIILFSIYIF